MRYGGVSTRVFVFRFWLVFRHALYCFFSSSLLALAARSIRPQHQLRLLQAPRQSRSSGRALQWRSSRSPVGPRCHCARALELQGFAAANDVAAIEVTANAMGFKQGSAIGCRMNWGRSDPKPKHQQQTNQPPHLPQLLIRSWRQSAPVTTLRRRGA